MPKEDHQKAPHINGQSAPQTSAHTQDKPAPLYTTEATAYLNGIYNEFLEQTTRYHDLTAHLLDVEARVELAEKTLTLIRDHLQAMAEKLKHALSHDWKKTLASVRFVGVRPLDACVTVLRENKKLTTDQMVDALNRGMFRFRTNSPAREIHAALMRQPYAKKTDDGWEWRGSREPKELRLVKPAVEPIESEKK